MQVNRRATARSRRGSAGASQLYNLVDFYIVDSVNYIGLYRFVIYSPIYCIILYILEIVRFCGILWDFDVFCSSENDVVRRMS